MDDPGKKKEFVDKVLFCTFNSLDFPWAFNYFSGMFWDRV
jgi:hypothetical protein